MSRQEFVRSRPPPPPLPPPLRAGAQLHADGIRSATTASNLPWATAHTCESRDPGQTTSGTPPNTLVSQDAESVEVERPVEGEQSMEDEHRARARPAVTQSRLLQIVKRRRRKAEITHIAHKGHEDKAAIAALLAREGASLAKRRSQVRTRENALVQRENALTQRENALTRRENTLTSRENELPTTQDVPKQKCADFVLREGLASLRLNTAQEDIIEHYQSKITALKTHLEAAHDVETAVRIEAEGRIARLQGRLDGRSELAEFVKDRYRDTQYELLQAQLLNQKLQQKLDTATRSNDELHRQLDDAYRVNEE
ncbi:hypothetical protein CBER1_05514 [Cercospora berteroae]|uniref:Uncharacterized protein n=1 Tax=Cercospora berteroae TaxID=357750 RepID=A0A2S6BST3_9PEZI|nr:hypothetical protein CBER1_05514 [Cercospora berteroae]